MSTSLRINSISVINISLIADVDGTCSLSCLFDGAVSCFSPRNFDWAYLTFQVRQILLRNGSNLSKRILSHTAMLLGIFNTGKLNGTGSPTSRQPILGGLDGS
jgi:hypothetical protein